MIQAERVRRLNERSVAGGRYVLYWMQASQRAEWNHALEYAVERANELELPLVVYFGLTEDFPEANLRHYAFMLEGLREVHSSLASRGIKLIVRRGSPEAGAVELSGEAALLVTDRGYLRVQKKWRRHVAAKAPCPVIEVECDVLVPVGVTSTKEEYSAATIRPKIQKRLDEFLRPLKARQLKADSLGLSLKGIDLSDLDAVLASLKVDPSVGRQGFYRGGTSRAKNHLSRFIEKKLADYAEKRNDPSLGIWSNMSPYLHFGQISPLYVALRVQGAKGVGVKSKGAYLEELIVRRELSVNFVNYNPHYDSYKCLHSWAIESLEKHSRDKREFIYTRGELESAKTHDPYWNAAMKEMALTGKMANYMRMYWGKKIIEWSSTPRAAFRTALYLNNKYFLDGRDPNSFAGVAWCFGKHDRAWAERPVFGKVRYMNAAGLKRKFDIDRYVDNIARLEK